MREQRVILEHNADAALARRQVVDRLPIEQHAAFGLPDEAGHYPQQGGLSAAGRPKQCDQFASRDIEIDIAHRDKFVEALRDVSRVSRCPRFVAMMKGTQPTI